MVAFRDFLLQYRLQHFAVALPIQLVISTGAMWLVVNWIQKNPEKEPLRRCALAAGLLYGVSLLAILMLRLPVPVIFFAAVIVWLAGSILVIRATFGLTQGGGATFFIYLMVLLVVHAGVKLVMGS